MPINNSILSVTFSCAIFLNAAATFAGQWVEVPGGASSHPSQLLGIATVSENDIWAVGSWGQEGGRGLIEHWDGTNWSVATVLPFGTLLWGVAARSSSDVWAVGQVVVLGQKQTLVEHWNGRRWVAVPSPSVGTYDSLYSVCIISRNDAWAVGSSSTLGVGNVYVLMHWDGTSWSLVNGPPANSSGLVSVKAFATDDVWAVGYKDFDYNQNTSSTFTLHWDGTRWSEIPSPNVATGLNNLNGVDGTAPNDVWAVGGSNLAALTMHWDGAVWSVVPTPVANATFHGLTVLSSANVIAVGYAATASSARWDGTQWRVVPVPQVNNPEYLWAISSHDGSVWAVGWQGPEPNDLIFKWTR